MAQSRFYVVLATDKPDMAKVRQEARPAHRAYLRRQAHVCIHAAGPLTDEQGEVMNGTFILCGAESHASVAAFVEGDPYFRSGLFGEIAIRRLDWTLGNPLRIEAGSAPTGAAIRTVS
jgi:hypothetical protein